MDRPAHGSVEFERKKRSASKCERCFDHAVVYYRADEGFSGSDRFSYQRIDPEDGEKRLVVVELRVAPSKASRARSSGMSRDAIRELQALLAKGGYEPGTVDGVAGARTWAAISRYERARGLPVTGTPTPDLLEKLRTEF